MLALRFAPPSDTGLRESFFMPVTGVKLATVCEIANNAAAHFSRIFDRLLSVDVFEPTIVPTESQPALFEDAIVFRGHGRTCDVLVIFRQLVAQRVVALAFREESETLANRLSALEEQVLERIGRELAVLCGPFCGDLNAFGRAHGRMEQYRCAAYFELRLGSPVDAAIGIGLSVDPAPNIGERIARHALGAVEVELRARLARTSMRARAVSRLAVGDVIPFETRLDAPATLVADATVVAHGDCGISDGTTAFKVTALRVKRES